MDQEYSKSVIKKFKAMRDNEEPALFTNELLEAKQKSVTFGDIDEQVMQNIIDYCYTRKIDLNEDNVQDVIQATSRLQINTLVDLGHLDDIADLINSLSILATVSTFTPSSLPKKALNLVLNHFDIFTKSQYFGQLGEKLLSDIISHDQLVVESEEDVLRTIIKWISEDIGTRAKSFDALLQHVRFASIRIMRLYEMKKEGVPFTSKKFHYLLNEAIEFRVSNYSLELIENYKSVNKFRPRQTAQFKYGQWLFIIYRDRRVVRYDPFLNESNDVSPKIGICKIKFKHCVGGTIIDDNLYIVTDYTDYLALERYNILDSKWSLLTPSNGFIRTERSGDDLRRVLAINESVYVVGEQVDIYKPKTNTAEQLTALSSYSGGAIYVNKLIYYYAGHYTHSSTGNCAIHLFCLDITTKTASELVSIPQEGRTRNYFGFTAYQGKLYIAGGEDKDGKGSQRFQCYHPKFKEWEHLPDMNFERGACELVELDGLLIVLGGEETNTSEVYNPVSRKWTEIKLNISTKDIVSTAKYERKSSKESQIDTEKGSLTDTNVATKSSEV